MNLRKPIKKFLINWNELLTVPIALVLWYYSPYLLYMIDPTAASFDAGILQVFLFAIIGTFLFSGVNWLIIKISFPKVYKYIDNQLEKDLWETINPGNRLFFALGFYFAHFLLLVLLSMAMPAV